MNQEQELAVLTELTRMPRTVVVVDMVESVRLIERYEEPTIRRWRTFVDEAVRLDAQPLGGRLVKSLGDGMMLEFIEPRPAVQCALAMQARLAKLNEPLSADERMDARIGIHAADVIVEREDIYGAGVNLAARVATLAGPGEIVVTPAVRDQVVDGLDANTEDLGECYFKHLDQPVRTFRVTHLTAPIDPPARPIAAGDVLPSIAVIPLVSESPDQLDQVLGDACADSINAALAQSDRWQVISRLTAARLRGRGLSASEIGEMIRADYVVSGGVWRIGGRLRVAIELAEAKTNAVLWADVLYTTAEELFASQDDVVPVVVRQVSEAVLRFELGRGSALPLPALRGYSILLQGIGLMHRLSRNDFSKAEQALEYLAQRYPRAPEPRAWLVKWYLLKVAQRWSADQAKDMKVAQQLAASALDRAPNHALCLALEAQIQGLFNQRVDLMRLHVDSALQANPHEPMAWLFKSAMHSYVGEGQSAVDALKHASGLSPLDPMAYLFDHFAAYAYVANAQWNQAIDAAHQALRKNRQHVSTYFWLAIAEAEVGNLHAAQAAVSYIRAVSPRSTAQMFVDAHPGGALPYVLRSAEALRAAGLS